MNSSPRIWWGGWLCAAALFLVSARLPAVAAERPPEPSLEQRLTAVEAYLRNADPTATTASVSTVAGLPGPGHNAWIMLSAALVLMMTLPGLILFYGGMVRTKNVLSVAAWCLGIASLVCVVWWAVGYSLVFGRNLDSPFLGGTEYFFLRGVGSAPHPGYSPWVSHNLFMVFQLTFAVITPAVLIGAVVERMRFAAVLWFTLLWLLVVYIPVAHMVWGANGFMNGLANPAAGIRAIDFAGGMVVEMASGVSGLVLCVLLGPRLGHGRTPMPPHSLVLTVVGTGFLWFGWYGFNAGSARAADGIAAHAFTTTTFAAAVAAGVWGLAEFLVRGRASVLGFCSGAIAGLVTITPACGFIDVTGAVFAGVLGSGAAFLACTRLKPWLGYDDALDVLGIHGVGGAVGLLVAGFWASPAVNPNLGALLSSLPAQSLWWEQLKGIGVTLTWSAVGTLLIGLLVRRLVGLRPDVESETEGLDLSEHGEEGYIFEPKA